jgi:hypothetical protein
MRKFTLDEILFAISNPKYSYFNPVKKKNRPVHKVALFTRSELGNPAG